jgi:hypothetical protein
LQIKTKIVSCHTADSKPAKQEVNGTKILPHLELPGLFHQHFWHQSRAAFAKIILEAFNGRQNLAKKAQKYGNFCKI